MGPSLSEFILNSYISEYIFIVGRKCRAANRPTFLKINIPYIYIFCTLLVRGYIINSNIIYKYLILLIYHTTDWGLVGLYLLSPRLSQKARDLYSKAYINEARTKFCIGFHPKYFFHTTFPTVLSK